MLKKVGAVFATGNRNAICENDDPTTISYHLGDKIMILQLLSYGGQNHDPTTITYHMGDKIMILQLLSYGWQNHDPTTIII